MADERCLHYKKLWRDLLRSSEINDCCIIAYQYNILYGTVSDYALCNHDNHLECPRYLNHEEKKKSLEREREKIVDSISHTD